MNVLPSSVLGKSLGVSSRPALPARLVSRPTLCKAEQEEVHSRKQLPKLQGAAAAVLAAGILITSAATPEEALAARSGGRVGGSSFRSAPSRAAPRRSGPTVNNYNYSASPAPPVFGGYGFGGYGYGGGISLFPTFVTPIGGGIFQFFLVAILASTVLGAIRSLVSRRRDDYD